jgi:hypothetical protein
MSHILLLFLIVFLLNVIPAFAPPTWIVFSFIGFSYPEHERLLLAMVGATAATLGRVCLAKGSQTILRRRILGEASRASIDAIRENLEQRRKLTFSLFLFYALTPLPSNYLFIAYGLTMMHLRWIAIPFFLGRIVSYSLWSFTGSTIARRISLESTETVPYLGLYFLLSQALLLFALYLFTRIDWPALFLERKLKWIAKSPAGDKAAR